MHWEAFVSAVTGSTVAGVLARAFIAKSLKDLEQAIDKIGDIKTELARIAVRLEGLDKAKDIVHKLDRKLVALETKVYGKHSRSVSDLSGN